MTASTRLRDRAGQLTLLGIPVDEDGPITRLADFDVLLVNGSAGKDSQAMLDLIGAAAEAQHVADRLVVVHAALGRVEWPGTLKLAGAQAARYDARFEVVQRDQDLLDQIEQRGMFPSSTARYCTSDHKRAQVLKLITRLVAERNNGRRRVRVLNMLGLRAQESPARAKKPRVVVNPRASNGRREVTDYLPIFDWTEDQVWARIRASRQADLIHPAYAAGMSRLSCVLCIFAPRHKLVLAAKLNPELARQYARLEQRIGHQFTQAEALG